MAKAMGLIFCCSMSLQPERCLFPYRCTYSPHSSLLIAKSVDFVVASIVIKLLVIFIVATLIAVILFKQLLIFTAA